MEGENFCVLLRSPKVFGETGNESLIVHLNKMAQTIGIGGRQLEI